jgi:hypothetical protein
LKELKGRSRTWRFLQLEREDKKLRFPSKLFHARASWFRARMFPSVGGTEPEKLFLCRASTDNPEKFPRKDGMGPVN